MTAETPTRKLPTDRERVAAARGGDRHVVAQLVESAQGEGYELKRFSMAEKPDGDGVWHRQLTLVVERTLDDLESIL